jgi:hypothetical protein
MGFAPLVSPSITLIYADETAFSVSADNGVEPIKESAADHNLAIGAGATGSQ